MKKREAEFCTKLQKWLKYNMPYTCVIEAKICEAGKPLNFKSAFKPHQLPVLEQASKKGFAYKISDADRTIKPFDIVYFFKAKAYVAIMWTSRGNNIFYLIESKAILEEMKENKSLTEEKAMKIAEIIGTLGTVDKTLLTI